MIHPLPQIEFSAIEVKHPAIPRNHHSLTAHISDIHMGPWIKQRHLEELVDKVNGYDPDLIALTGDYVGYRKGPLIECAEALRKLNAPTYAVLGNHDHWADTKLAVTTFERNEIDLLRNENRRVELPGFHFNLVGVDDEVTNNADVPKAHKGIINNDFTLTLNHVPSIADACAQHGSDLILSGHTHGLQFNVPRLTARIAKIAKMKYIDGCYHLDEGLLFVSRGIGSASWPRRYDAFPEIALLTLSHGDIPEIKKLTSWRANLRR